MIRRIIPKGSLPGSEGVPSGKGSFGRDRITMIGTIEVIM